MARLLWSEEVYTTELGRLVYPDRGLETGRRTSAWLDRERPRWQQPEWGPLYCLAVVSVKTSGQSSCIRSQQGWGHDDSETLALLTRKSQELVRYHKENKEKEEGETGGVRICIVRVARQWPIVSQQCWRIPLC